MARTLAVTFPAGGNHRQTAVQRQPPYTTASSLNVRATDVLLQRARGSTRPGLSKYLATQFGSGSGTGRIIRALTSMAKDDGTVIIVYVADGSIAARTIADGAVGSSASGLSAAGRICHAFLGSEVFFAQAGVTQPYYWNVTSGTGGAHANAMGSPLGDVPTGCDVVFNHMNRLCFANDGAAVRQLYMSRVGDPHDFAYGDDDVQRAISEEVVVPGGVNDGLVAAIPCKSDYTLLCGKQSMIMMVGDRADGGYYVPISQRHGTLDSMSWCHGPNGSKWIMTAAGPAVWSAGNMLAEPELVSNITLPLELKGIDPATYEVVMAWDDKAGEIRIWKTKTTSTADVVHWRYDIANRAWWPDTYTVNCEPFSVCNLPNSTATNTSLIQGGRNGYVRYDDLAAATDDGTNFESYVFLGPFLGGDAYHDGIVSEVIVTLAANSGAANWSLHVGPDAETALAASAIASGTLAAGRNPPKLPRRRCGSFYLKIYGTAGTKWAFESACVKLLAGGQQRHLV